MYLSYFDESGDDGYPEGSPLFVLASVYMPDSVWKENHATVANFRKELKRNYGLPVGLEFHTKEFLTNKNPYTELRFSETLRKKILFDYCRSMAHLRVRCIVTAIVKSKVRRPTYDVLKKALTYNVQRIENHMKELSDNSKFIIIADEGRIGKMRKTTREMQKFNFIPSQYGGSYREEIKRLIEDPLPKSSDQSYFIQLADLVCYISSLYIQSSICNPSLPWSGRVAKVLSPGDELVLLEILKPILNLKASPNERFGIVYYPK